jgi:hypothetical protein
VASLDSRSSRSDEIATLIIVQAKLTVDLCYLLGINYAESPEGTSRRCEFDFAGRANSSYHNERIYYMVYVIEGCSSESHYCQEHNQFCFDCEGYIYKRKIFADLAKEEHCKNCESIEAKCSSRMLSISASRVRAINSIFSCSATSLPLFNMYII